MKVTKRIVSTKRHTLGYVLGNNQRVTRGQAVRMARRGHLEGVVAKHGVDSWYITTTPTSEVKNLYSLPSVVV